MLNLTKPAKETAYMKFVRVLLSTCFLVVPLIFFTDLTANPFFAQNVLLYILLALIYSTLAVKFLRSNSIEFTKTFFDLAFFLYVLACVMGWLSSVSAAPQGMRFTLFYGLLNYGSLLLIVSLGAYMLSKNIVFSGTIESKTNYILLFLVWGGLWYFFPMLKTHLNAQHLFAQMFDWYAILLWAIGIYLGVRVLRKLTQENIFVLMFVAVFLACCYGVMQAFGLDFLWPFEINQFATKAFSTFGNPNFLSSAIVMLLPALLVYYMHTDSKKDLLVYGLLVLVYIWYLSFGLARSCWIGAACGLFMMWMFGTLRAQIWRRKGRVFLLTLLAVGVGWGSIYMPGPDAVSPVVKRANELTQVTPSNFSLKVDKDQIFQSLHQRLFMWDISKEIFLSSPVLGSGLGNFQFAFIKNQPKTLLAYPNLRELKTITPAPHNELFFQLAQGGMVGLGLFVFMFMVLFLEVKDFAIHKKEGDKKQFLQALFCGILGMLVDNMLNISLHAVVPAFLFWWIVGAEVSGVGKEELKVTISANPVTKTIALAILILSGAIVVWQVMWMGSEYHAFMGKKHLIMGNAYNHQADAKKAEEEFNKAERHLRTSVNLYPANTELSGFYLGNLYLAQKKYDKALEVFEKTSKAMDYREEIFYQSALASIGVKDDKKAVNYLLKHLNLHPYHLYAYHLLLDLLDKNIIYCDEDVLNVLERGLTLFPYDTNLWLETGRIYEKMGNTEYAKNTYRRGLAVDTLSATLLGRLKKLEGKEASQNKLIAQAQELQKYNEKVGKFSKMSSAYQQKLRRNLETYITDYPQDTNGRILLARVLSLSGNDIKAKEELESVLETQPDNLWARLALSSLYEKAEDEPDALRELNEALFYYPENATAQARIKKIIKKQEKNDRVRK